MILTKNVNDFFSILLWHLGKQMLLQQQCFYFFLDWAAVVGSGLSLRLLVHLRTAEREDGPRYLALPFKICQLGVLALLAINAAEVALS